MSSAREFTIRAATPADMPRIRQLHAGIEDLMGKKMDLLDLESECDKRALLGMWVTEEDGVIIEGFYLEKVGELCFFGREPRSTAEVRKHQELFFEMARRAGMRFIHCQVPKEFDRVGKHLDDSGFADTTAAYTHYVLDLR